MRVVVPALLLTILATSSVAEAQTLRERWNGAHGRLGPAREIPRRVLMVPGLFMKARSFNPMARHLLKNGNNGRIVAVYNAKDGKFHLNSAKGRVLARHEVRTAKIFQLEYRDPRAPSTEKAPQIQAALEAMVADAPDGHAREIDVVTHSAGAHNFTEYLGQRGAGDRAHIRNVVMVTPAILGTAMGNLGRRFGGIVGARAAASELALGSSSMAEQRAAWPGLRQKHIAGEVTVIAVTGAPTVTREAGRLRVRRGDGFMPTEQTRLPGARNVTVHGINPTPLNHILNNRYSGTITATEDGLRR